MSPGAGASSRAATSSRSDVQAARRRVVSQALVVAVLAALIVSGCGGSDSGVTKTDTGATGTTGSLTRTSTSTQTYTEPALPMPLEPQSALAGVQLIAQTLQTDLLQLGYDPGAIDGQFAAKTQAALKRWQAAKGISQAERGALGPATATALGPGVGGGSAVVQALQSALTDVGLFNATINGRYDAATVAAVKALQERERIQADGFYGVGTAAALTRLYREDAPEPVKDAGEAPSEQSLDSSSLLKLGSDGPAVKRLQDRLVALGYRPGQADGSFGAATASAVLAFQKRTGLIRDSVVGPIVEAELKQPKGAGPPSGPVPRIDVDIARQLVFVVLKSSVITLNSSTGSGEHYKVPGGGTDIAYTPVGDFTVIRKISGDHKAPLGTLRSPIYFYKGWAIHGAANVPAYPASHGCARISNTDADWLYPQIPLGTPVIVYDTSGKSPTVAQLASGAAPGY
jgi:peptidoglycan hydrolase-like protein with peptidoglycan-binding domain